MKRYLKPLAFSLMGLIILLLMAATISEKILGTAFAMKYFYTAPWTIALWFAAAVSGIAYIWTVKMYKQVITCLLHFSFVVILAGAMITHLFGQQGQIHLRIGEAPVPVLTRTIHALCTDYAVEYYPGTTTPMDYVSQITILDGDRQVHGQVSMNKIFTYRHIRFYQAQYDADGLGTTLNVSYDPWGIGVTYAGYALLLFSMLAFFVQKRTHFKRLLASPLLRSALVMVLMGLPVLGSAQPRTLQRPVAAAFGHLYVYYNNRVCPVSTLANDFCTKLYGKPEYRGLTADQVLTGWFFYYDDWAKEPMIKIKGTEVRQVLGIEGKYASIHDYAARGAYKLDSLLRAGDKNARAADEKFQLISMVSTGTLLRIWPVMIGDSASAQPNWLRIGEQIPQAAGSEEQLMVSKGMNYVAYCLMQGQNKEAFAALHRIRDWQAQHAGEENLPTELRFQAEQNYNRMHYTRPLAMACATMGLLLFFICCLLLSQGQPLNTYVHYTLSGLMVVLWGFLTYALALRWIVSGHVPLSNGFETMQFLAWVTALFTAVLSFMAQWSKQKSSWVRSGLFLAFGYLLCGMTLMVSMMSSANPQITLLMPVLQSPLLTIHVAVIMIAYCLLAFIMLNGLTALFLHVHGQCKQVDHTVQLQRLQIISQILLYPAVFLLTIGIFIGAVWANISWGRYWGWDPKEVWALITLLIYAAPVHTQSLSFLRQPLTFHIYVTLAFLAVLFTYFGVNFLLGGLHSYA